MADENTTTETIWKWVKEAAGEVADKVNEFVKPDNTGDAFLEQSRYDFNYRTFPYDLGAGGTPNQHYMVININVRNSNGLGGGSQFIGSINGPNGSNIKTFEVVGDDMSKIDVLRFNLDKQYTSSSGQPLGQYGNNGLVPVIPRFTRRIVESIAIFMPQSVQFSNQHEYESISVMTLGTDIVGSAASGLPMPKKTNDLGDLVAGGISGVLQRGGNLAQLAQTPLNPMSEILFRTTPQRGFTFDWLLAPSNRAESVAMDQIYRVLKFHAAPEHISLLGMPFMVSPSEFDITFFHRGKENTALPRINTCVLQQIDMDYSPTGLYSTFSNGAPVQARMTLQFRELEAVTKLRVVQGF
jgi:hypothetical protein